MQWASWKNVLSRPSGWLGFIYIFFLIQVNNKCKPANFNIWYRWVVNANNSWRMSDKAVLFLYQDDDFILGMQNSSCCSSPNQKRIHKPQLQAHDPQWNCKNWAFLIAHITHHMEQHTTVETSLPALLPPNIFYFACWIYQSASFTYNSNKWPKWMLFQAMFACK